MGNMVRKVRKLHRRLAGPLVLLWLVFSNTAWCALASEVSTPLPASESHHGASHGEAMHHQPAPESGHSGHGDHASGCCDSGLELPCCSDSVYAPGFDSPVQAKLLSAAIPPPLLIEPRDHLVAWQGFSEMLIRPPGGPPVFIRCCSWLI